MKILTPESECDFERYYFLRWKILRAPWGQERGTEKDSLDSESEHVMVCSRDGQLMGVGRLHFLSPTEGQIRFMAVDAEFQGQGVGRLIVEHIEQRARRQGAENIILDARASAVGFYEKCGYTVQAPSHVLFGSIEHFRMRKRILI